MKTELAIKLQSILKNMPQKAFDKIWSKVIKDKKDSPSFKEVTEVLNSNKREEYITLAFINLKEAKKAQEDIKTYFKDRIICAEIIEGTDERGSAGFMIVYALTK